MCGHGQAPSLHYGIPPYFITSIIEIWIINISPGQHVGKELETELNVVEFLLEAGEPLLDHVLPAVHVRHDFVHGILRLK